MIPQLHENVGVIEAPNQHGEPVRLGAGDGWSLLFFYPFAFTGICTGELKTLDSQREEYAGLGCRVAGMSCDSMFSQRVFADQEGLSLELLSDFWPHGRIAQWFGVLDEERGCATRASFLLDPEGGIRWSVVNPVDQGRDLDAQLAAVRQLVG